METTGRAFYRAFIAEEDEGDKKPKRLTYIYNLYLNNSNVAAPIRQTESGSNEEISP